MFGIGDITSFLDDAKLGKLQYTVGSNYEALTKYSFIFVLISSKKKCLDL